MTIPPRAIFVRDVQKLRNPTCNRILFYDVYCNDEEIKNTREETDDELFNWIITYTVGCFIEILEDYLKIFLL